MLHPHLSLELLSQTPMTDLPTPTRELQHISTSATQMKDGCPVNVLLATCSFLKPHHLRSWSGVIRTMDSESMPPLLTQGHKECARCGTPAKPVWHEDSAIKEASDAYWWLRNCCWHAFSENLNGTEPQVRLPEGARDRCITLLLTLTSPGYLASVFVLWCTSFAAVLGESTLSDQHPTLRKRAESPGLPLSSQSSPMQSEWPFTHSRFQIFIFTGGQPHC